MATPLFQFSGVSSGLDTKAIIDALMAVRSQPLVRIQTQDALLASRKTDYGVLSGLFADLLSKLQAFTQSKAGASLAATSSDTSILTAVAASTAAPGRYSIDVQRLATATVARSTAAVGAAIDPARAAGTLASLNFSTAITAGTMSFVVDGTLLQVPIVSPTSETLQGTINNIASTIAAQINATDPLATVTATIVGNKLQFTIANESGPHSVSFGAVNDTSNFFNVTGLSGVSSAAFITGAPLNGTRNLGVSQVTKLLDSASIPGLVSTTTGQLSINGTIINYNTTTDTLLDVVQRINASPAGVTASLDRINDRVTLTANTPGASAFNLTDIAGNLLTQLNLAPGTTAAQTIGSTAQIAIDGGAPVVFNTNQITDAIPGLTLSLARAVPGTPITLTVAPNAAAVSQSVTDLVKSFNALADTIDKVTNPKTGSLANDPTVQGIMLDLRSRLFSASGGTGPIRSLQDIGITTGNVGAAPRSTNRLVLDSTKLTNALAANPSAVATLLDASTSALANVVTRLKGLTALSTGLIDSRTTSITRQLAANAKLEATMQSRLDAERLAMTAKWAAQEAIISQYKAQLAALGAQVNTFYSNPYGTTAPTTK